MTNQITLKKALELVEFELCPEGWRVKNVKGNVWGDVKGNVRGDVGGTINGRQWRSIKTPREKLKRLIEEGADKGTLLAAVNQLEDSNG